MTISSPERHRAAIPEMRRIVAAIAAGDADAETARDHIHIVTSIAREFLQQS